MAGVTGWKCCRIFSCLYGYYQLYPLSDQQRLQSIRILQNRHWSDHSDLVVFEYPFEHHRLINTGLEPNYYLK